MVTKDTFLLSGVIDIAESISNLNISENKKSYAKILKSGVTVGGDV